MDIHSLCEKTLMGLGYELVSLEYFAGKNICIFADRQPDGITVEDCAAISRHLTRVLTVEEVDYKRLEVSSPGLDRPLKTKEDFLRATGKLVCVKACLVPEEKPQKIIGRLVHMEGEALLIHKNEDIIRVLLTDIHKARLEPEFQLK